VQLSKTSSIIKWASSTPKARTSLKILSASDIFLLTGPHVKAETQTILPPCFSFILIASSIAFLSYSLIASCVSAVLTLPSDSIF